MSFCRAPQGYLNSAFYLSEAIFRSIGHLSQHLIFYADDILIYSCEDEEYHINIVIDVLKCLFKSGFKVSPKKLQVC